VRPCLYTQEVNENKGIVMKRSALVQAMLDERNRTLKEFTPDHRPLVMYAIYRKDLEMLPEKLSSQTGHAYCMSMKVAKEMDPTLEERYMGTGNGTKVVMYGKNEAAIERAYLEAKAAGIPCALIIDRGTVSPPHFDGSAIVTAVGIGPVYADVAKDITKRYSMTRPVPVLESAPVE
jgi:PTH2 family peptidyl-tRNA hydrolase